MCGRYTLKSTVQEISQIFDTTVDTSLLWSPGEQVRPTERIPVVIEQQGARVLRLMQWAFIPAWSKEPPKPPLINARSETAFEKPSFREAIRHRRAIVPAYSFIEWKREGREKTPYAIRALSDKPLFGMASIWETWKTPGGADVDTVAILTTEPNEVLSSIHDRMPVILKPESYKPWLSPQTPLNELKALLVPFAAAHTHAQAMSQPAQGSFSL